MYEVLRWIAILSTSVIIGLAIAGLVVLYVSISQKRRNARFVAELAARYQAAQQAEEPRQSVSVDELVARIEEEGLPVRLNWDDASAGENEAGEWPTAVIPRVEPEG